MNKVGIDNKDYFPRKFIYLVLAVSALNFFLVLAGQPAGYWENYNLAMIGDPIGFFFVSRHPALFISVAILYLVGVYLLLRLLPALFGYFIAVLIFLGHAVASATWLGTVYRKLDFPYFPFLNWYLITIFYLVLAFLVAVLIVRHWRFTIVLSRRTRLVLWLLILVPAGGLGVYSFLTIQRPPAAEDSVSVGTQAIFQPQISLHGIACEPSFYNYSLLIRAVKPIELGYEIIGWLTRLGGVPASDDIKESLVSELITDPDVKLGFGKNIRIQRVSLPPVSLPASQRDTFLFELGRKVFEPNFVERRNSYPHPSVSRCQNALVELKKLVVEEVHYLKLLQSIGSPDEKDRRRDPGVYLQESTRNLIFSQVARVRVEATKQRAVIENILINELNKFFVEIEIRSIPG